MVRYFQTENLMIAASGRRGRRGASRSTLESVDGTQLRAGAAAQRLRIVGAVIVLLLGQLAVLWPALRAASIPPALATRGASRERFAACAIRYAPSVIDDNPAVGQALDLLFGCTTYALCRRVTPQQGLAVLARERVDLVIADMNFSADTTSGEEGTALFRAIRAPQPDLPVILLTAWTHLESAVQLVKAGAADYIGKPWDNDKLLATVENLLELAESHARYRQRLQDERRARRERLARAVRPARHRIRIRRDGERGRARLSRRARRRARC